MKKIDLCARIPHAGDMCLLESVEHWDAETIRCRAVSHRDIHNPLRRQNKLAALCGVEYAAQAMAVHGSLVEAGPQQKPTIGFLASLRQLRLTTECLDEINDDLYIDARRLSGNADSLLYEFSVQAAGRELLSGRAAVKLGEAQT